jgi:hypothetical protein
MNLRLPAHDRRRILSNVALIAGLFGLGSLCGVGARTWIGGIEDQRAQLQRCVLTSRGSHPNEDARSRLTHLDADVPACMSEAGYEKALDNVSCSPAYWQGDASCYSPKSRLGKLIHRLQIKAGER